MYPILVVVKYPDGVCIKDFQDRNSEVASYC